MAQPPPVPPENAMDRCNAPNFSNIFWTAKQKSSPPISGGFWPSSTAARRSNPPSPTRPRPPPERPQPQYPPSRGSSKTAVRNPEYRPGAWPAHAKSRSGCTTRSDRVGHQPTRAQTLLEKIKRMVNTSAVPDRRAKSTLPGGNTGQHLPAPRQALPSLRVGMALGRGLWH